MSATIPVVVLGATGYVAGELLRLTHSHPSFTVLGAASRGNADKPIASVFPHLAPAFPDTRFVTPAKALELAGASEQLALFSAAPHGTSAALLDPFLNQAEKNGGLLHIVDASADFRFASPSAFEQVYGIQHGAPGRFDDFVAGVPEHTLQGNAQHAGNPGCFASAMLLASVPLLANKLIEPNLFAAGITGSTGSGKTPIATTHHPERNSNIYAYKALTHRHVPEVVELAEKATGVTARFRFIPHSGPFARGIHMTVQATLQAGHSQQDIEAKFREFYQDSDFVHVVTTPPRLKDVVGSNHANIAVACDDETVAVFCVIDNLLKGASGSAMQWMNRLFSLPETSGLNATAPGWI